MALLSSSFFLCAIKTETESRETISVKVNCDMAFKARKNLSKDGGSSENLEGSRGIYVEAGGLSSNRRFFDRKCFVSNSDKIWGVEGQPKFHFQGQKKLVYEGHT